MKYIIKCIGWVLLNIVLQIVVQFGMSVYAVSRGMHEKAMVGQWIMDNMLLAALIANAAFILSTVLIHKIKRVNIPEQWRLRKAKAINYIMPCVIAFLFSMSFSFITYDTSLGNTLPIQASVDYYNEKAAFLGIFLLVINLLVLAPVSEEILCRGIMITQLERKFPASTAIIISSLIFGVMHIMAGGFSLAVGAAIMGLLLGIIYVKTGSLCVAAAAHCAANLPDFIFMGVHRIDGTLKIVLAVVMLLLSLLCMLLWLTRSRKRYAAEHGQH